MNPGGAMQKTPADSKRAARRWWPAIVLGLLLLAAPARSGELFQTGYRPLDPLAPLSPLRSTLAGAPRFHLTVRADLAVQRNPKQEPLRVYLPLPADAPYQQIHWFRLQPEPAEIRQTRDGYRIAVWDCGRPAPGTAIVIVYEAEASLGRIEWEIEPNNAGGLGEIPPVLAREFLADREPYALHNPLVIQAAREAAGDNQNPLAILRGVVRTVKKRLSYRLDNVKNDAGATLAQGHGSCTEYAFAMIALARRNGLPARYIAGLHARPVVPAAAKLHTANHKIVEFYLPRYGWLPVDTTKASLKFDDPKGKITGRIDRTMIYFTHEPEADAAPLDPRVHLFTATSGETDTALQIKKRSTVTWEKK